ncbi:hypothetical protein BLOT_015594 [Blomia tropicalis]|nr:hypothetical protein BLOT_015594 [Blomia tropicalis]
MRQPLPDRLICGQFKFEDLIGIYNPILEKILMMVFTIRKIFDRSNMQSDRNYKFVSNKRVRFISHSINQSIDVVVDHH